MEERTSVVEAIIRACELNYTEEFPSESVVILAIGRLSREEETTEHLIRQYRSRSLRPAGLVLVSTQLRKEDRWLDVETVLCGSQTGSPDGLPIGWKERLTRRARATPIPGSGGVSYMPLVVVITPPFNTGVLTDFLSSCLQNGIWTIRLESRAQPGHALLLTRRDAQSGSKP
jgi:hypothetical protein